MFLLNSADKRQNHFKTTKQSRSLDVVCKKVNLDILKDKKMHKLRTNKILKKHPLTSLFPVKPATSLKINPQRDISHKAC